MISGNSCCSMSSPAFRLVSVLNFGFSNKCVVLSYSFNVIICQLDCGVFLELVLPLIFVFPVPFLLPSCNTFCILQDLIMAPFLLLFIETGDVFLYQFLLSYSCYFLVLVNNLCWKWWHRKKEKDRATHSSFSFQSLLTYQETKGGDCR